MDTESIKWMTTRRRHHGSFLLQPISPRADVPGDITESEKWIMKEHFAYWAGLLKERKVVVSGQVKDPSGTLRYCRPWGGRRGGCPNYRRTRSGRHVRCRFSFRDLSDACYDRAILTPGIPRFFKFCPTCEVTYRNPATFRPGSRSQGDGSK